MDDPDADTVAQDRMHATNYLGVIALIRAASRVLRDNGRIISISSGLGTRVGAKGPPEAWLVDPKVSSYT